MSKSLMTRSWTRKAARITTFGRMRQIDAYDDQRRAYRHHDTCGIIRAYRERDDCVCRRFGRSPRRHTSGGGLHVPIAPSSTFGARQTGIVWIDPTARKTRALIGLSAGRWSWCRAEAFMDCAVIYIRSKVLRRHGCVAAFGPNGRDGSSSKSGLTAAETTTKVCGLFDAKFHGAGGGWQLLRNVLNSSKLPSTTSALIFSSGHHISGEALKTHWTDVASRDAAFAVARKQGVRLILQEHEQQHFSHGGEYNATLHGMRQSIHTLNTRQAIRHSRCEMLPESAVSPRYELEKQHVIPHLLANGFEVLPTHAISRAAWFGHTHAAPTPSGATDCTHFCMPGIPDIWAAILLGEAER